MHLFSCLHFSTIRVWGCHHMHNRFAYVPVCRNKLQWSTCLLRWVRLTQSTIQWASEVPPMTKNQSNESKSMVFVFFARFDVCLLLRDRRANGSSHQSTCYWLKPFEYHVSSAFLLGICKATVLETGKSGTKLSIEYDAWKTGTHEKLVLQFPQRFRKSRIVPRFFSVWHRLVSEWIALEVHLFSWWLRYSIRIHSW
jgi:hypothetical protein